MPLIAFLAAVRLTEKRRAVSSIETPAACISRIPRTTSGVSFDDGCEVPRGYLHSDFGVLDPPFLCLPFASMIPSSQPLLPLVTRDSRQLLEVRRAVGPRTSSDGTLTAPGTILAG